MTESFSLINHGENLVLTRKGEEQGRNFKSEPEAIEAARQSLSEPKGEVAILDPASGLCRTVNIEAGVPGSTESSG